MSNRHATQIAAVVAIAILVSLPGCVCPGGTCDRAAAEALTNQAPGQSDDCQREIYGDPIPTPEQKTEQHYRKPEDEHYKF